MNRMKTLGGLAVIVVALAAFSFFRGGGVAPKPEVFANSTDYGAAVEASRTSGKPVLAFVTADWCGPCQSLKHGALIDPEVVAAIRAGTQPVYVDATGDNDQVDALNVTGVPALILLKPDGKGEREISRLVGNVDSRELLAWLASAKE